MENTEKLLKSALNLKPQEKFIIIEGLINSLDEPDKNIDDIWIEESYKRLKAHREGKTKGVSFKEIFNEDL